MIQCLWQQACEQICKEVTNVGWPSNVLVVPTQVDTFFPVVVVKVCNDAQNTLLGDTLTNVRI